MTPQINRVTRYGIGPVQLIDVPNPRNEVVFIPEYPDELGGDLFWVDPDECYRRESAFYDDDRMLLDLEKCWRCAMPVPRDDDLGLCQKCVVDLKDL